MVKRKGSAMRDYDSNFNSAEYDRSISKKKTQKRRGKTDKIKQKRKKYSGKWFSAYYLDGRYKDVEPIYEYEVIPEHTKTITRTYFDPYATDYGFDENKNRVVKKRGRQVTEVSKVVIPEKRTRRLVGYREVSKPKPLKRKSVSGLKKFVKSLAKKRVRSSENDDSSIVTRKRSGHKRVYDHWLDD